jgi:hypothetical protein
MATKRKLKRVGFFRELSHGDADGPSLAESMRDAPGADDDSIVEYLNEGVPFILSPGPVFDVMDGEGPVGTASILTDGEWAWPDDLAAYVEKYHVRLPDEFVQHARANQWLISDLERDQLRALTLR